MQSAFNLALPRRRAGSGCALRELGIDWKKTCIAAIRTSSASCGSPCRIDATGRWLAVMWGAARPARFLRSRAESVSALTQCNAASMPLVAVIEWNELQAELASRRSCGFQLPRSDDPAS